MQRRIYPVSFALRKYMHARKLSPDALAALINSTPRRIYAILQSKTKLSPDMALRFERVFGVSAERWLAIQNDWDLFDLRNLHAAEYDAIKQVGPLRKRDRDRNKPDPIASDDPA